jgi:hypothetical protein
MDECGAKWKASRGLGLRHRGGVEASIGRQVEKKWPDR